MKKTIAFIISIVITICLLLTNFSACNYVKANSDDDIQDISTPPVPTNTPPQDPPPTDGIPSPPDDGITALPNNGDDNTDNTDPQPLDNTPKSPVALPEDYDADKPSIALTFDDGPSAATTPQLLDILEQYNVQATFFIQGKMAVRAPEIVVRAYNLGCEIANHTYGHKKLTEASVDEINSQIGDVDEIIFELTGGPCRLVRPPYGAKNDYVRENVPHPLILWSIDTLDWSTRKTMSSEKSIQSTIDSVLNYVKDGDIILMHDIHPETIEAVKSIVPELLKEGYQLLTVSQLFEAKGIEISAGHDYRNAYPPKDRG